MFEKAMQTVINREEEISKIMEIIEVNLELIGSTAIEDKLQDGVSNHTIFYNLQMKQFIL